MKRVVLLAITLAFMGALSSVSIVFAQQTSTNYQANEYFFGTGGDLEQQSANYRASASAGSLGSGLFASDNYDAAGGFLTQADIFLSMQVFGATVNLGDLDPATASSGAAQSGACSCSFAVRTYLSSQYTVVTMSQPPISEGGAVLNAKTVLGVPSSDPNVEEFGINLVDNSSPNIGANPSNQPDNTFADGQAATGYSTIDQFKYNVGDIIARSQATAGNQAVGLTYYTISYTAKPSNLTEAGSFRMDHDLVVVPRY